MPRSTTAHCNALAVYVCDTDARRTKTYPFTEGQDIPHQINESGDVFTLRSVNYDGKVAA